MEMESRGRDLLLVTFLVYLSLPNFNMKHILSEILVSPGRPGPTLKPGPLEEKQQRTQLECDRLSHLLEADLTAKNESLASHRIANTPKSA